jgi:DNA gyrase subunit A
LINSIVEAVKLRKITQIADLRDESNRLGIRIVITLRRDTQSDIVLNQLFKLTPLQTNFTLNLLALKEQQPEVMNLLQVISLYVKHQINVLVRKTKYLLAKDEKRLSILSAINKALQNIDKVIELIKKSANHEAAVKVLKSFLKIDDTQAKAILDMRLQRLTGLQQELVLKEIQELEITIQKYRALLASPEKQKDSLIERLEGLKEKYGKPRKTEVISEDKFGSLNDEDLILRQNDYLKRVNLNDFRQQKRGGVGVKGITLNEQDSIKTVLQASTHDNLLFFTNVGKVYQLKTFKVPDLGRTAKGTPAQNLINIDINKEQIESIIRVSGNEQNYQSLFFVTGKGIVKRTLLKSFDLINRSGKIAIKLREKD